MSWNKDIHVGAFAIILVNFEYYYKSAKNALQVQECMSMRDISILLHLVCQTLHHAKQ